MCVCAVVHCLVVLVVRTCYAVGVVCRVSTNNVRFELLVRGAWVLGCPVGTYHLPWYVVELSFKLYRPFDGHITRCT